MEARKKRMHVNVDAKEGDAHVPLFPLPVAVPSGVWAHWLQLGRGTRRSGGRSLAVLCKS